jgi:hypothetical protein
LCASTGNQYPDIYEPTPEVIMKCCRIFQMENEDVSTNSDNIKDNHQLAEDCKSKMKLKETDTFW